MKDEGAIILEMVAYYQTTIGRVGIVENGIAITHVYFAGEAVPRQWQEGETPLLREAAKQLEEYLAGERRVFELPLAPAGTAFYRKVWAALQTIPWGETRSYGEIAQMVGSPRAYRAVGTANHHNPIPIIIPCHRVIGANGKLVGYGGGLALKAQLLAVEHITVGK